MKRMATQWACLAALFGGLCMVLSGCLVPDTGQTGSYTATFGEDSDYTRFPQSYTKLDITGAELPDTAVDWAMIQDDMTGLIWENKTYDYSIHHWENVYTWEDAQVQFIDQLNASAFGGYTDWRLPNPKELLYIAYRNVWGPAIDDDYFPLTDALHYFVGYWTDTEWPGGATNAYFVHYESGTIRHALKSDTMHVRAVRGDPITTQYFTDNGDGTVSDGGASLMWEKKNDNNYASGMYWEQALNYCESLSYAGYTDWRLPNVNELTSVVDYSRYDPSIDTAFFPRTVSDYYWSSTSIQNGVMRDAAADVSFRSGWTVPIKKANGANSRKLVRCVRSIKYSTYPTQ